MEGKNLPELQCHVKSVTQVSCIPAPLRALWKRRAIAGKQVVTVVQKDRGTGSSTLAGSQGVMTHRLAFTSSSPQTWSQLCYP